MDRHRTSRADLGTAALFSAPHVAVLTQLVIAATLLLVVWQSAERLAPGEAGFTSRPSTSIADGILGPWLRWDSNALHDIAENGYTSRDEQVYDAGGQSRIAYFPGYPITARAVGAVIGDIPLAMELVTFASGLGVAVLFSRWARRHSTADAAGNALLALLLFPWALFLVANGYSDALFLLCSLGAFVLLEEDRPYAAAASGFVATLTRPVGGAVTVGLLLVAWQRRRGTTAVARPTVDRRAPSTAAIAALGASIGGLAAFMAFCWARYGHPLAFSIAQRGWDQATGPRTWFKVPFFEAVQDLDNRWFVGRLALHGAVALVFAASIPAVWRRFGAAYGTYTAIVVLVPLVGSAAFASQGRYVLAAFPVFALLGERLSEWTDVRRYGYLGLSAVGLLANASFWARGYWMG